MVLVRLQLRHLFALLAVVAVFAIGTFGTYILSHSGGFNMGAMGFIDSLYYTTVTMGLVGSANVWPVTTEAKLFVVSIIILGIGVFISAITLVSVDFMNDRISNISNRITSFEKRHLKEHTILLGANGFNLSLAKRLKAEKSSFIMLTQDKQSADRLMAMGYRAIVSDPNSEHDLAQLSIDGSKEIVIDLESDSKTVYTLLIMRSLAPKTKKIIIIQNEGARDQITKLGHKKGEVIINPNALAVESVMRDIVR
jgi:voltage-gated potassium channel